MKLKTVPNSIRNKFQSYTNHTQKAEKLRLEIEAWFLSNGIDIEEIKVLE